MNDYKTYLNENKEQMSEEEIKSVYDDLKKGDEVTITYDSSWNGENTQTFIVKKEKTKVGKAKVERITLVNPKNPKGVKYYLYYRNQVTFAIGDMGASIIKIEKK